VSLIISMKIAYLLYHDIKSNSGVTKKIKGQIDEWRKNGHQVCVYAFVPSKGVSILDAKQYINKSPFFSRLLLNSEVLSDISTFSPDIVYFRYDIWSKTLSKILKRYKVIVELNTLDLDEFLLLLKEKINIRSLFMFLGYLFLRGYVLNNVSGIIAVTKEIAEHKTIKKYKKRTTHIPNGINLSEYTVIKDPNTHSDRIGLFFMGSPNQPWHGVDIIEKLSKQLPEYDFHIVGMGGNSTKNLFWHGYLQQEEYINVLRKCHICIGTLALHRNNLNEACPLKVREYLAYGFPTIIGYKDTSFPEPLPDFLFYLDPSLKNLTELIIFINKNKNRIVTHSEIDVISIEKIETKRLLFFNEINDN